MHIDSTPSNLDRTHHIGQKKASSNKPKAVMNRFVSYNTRKIIFQNKRLLKLTQVSITKSLTGKRMRILRRQEKNTNYGTC